MTEQEWKAAFIAEFAKHVDRGSGPANEIADWVKAEADGAFEGTENALDTDPAEEAREALYCIGAME